MAKLLARLLLGFVLLVSEYGRTASAFLYRLRCPDATRCGAYDLSIVMHHYDEATQECTNVCVLVLFFNHGLDCGSCSTRPKVSTTPRPIENLSPRPTMSLTTAAPSVMMVTVPPTPGFTPSPTAVTLEPTTTRAMDPETSPPTPVPPSISPTGNPTISPSFAPSMQPVVLPTTMSPTAGPTVSPSSSPTPAPTSAPTVVTVTVPPTQLPTENPVVTPSNSPTLVPTSAPTVVTVTVPPTQLLTENPTTSPTDSPTSAPTFAPTFFTFTVPPTQLLTGSPTISPTLAPTIFTLTTVPPTLLPTANPTVSPTDSPTFEPTSAPTTATVTAPPTQLRTKNPTMAPTDSPTLAPTLRPTIQPTVAPSMEPLSTTSMPTKRPTRAPTEVPIVQSTPSPTLDKFDITFTFIDVPVADQEIIRSAAAVWESVIVGDLPDQVGTNLISLFPFGSPCDNMYPDIIDDLHLCIGYFPDYPGDGPGNVLGVGGAERLNSNNLPFTGIIALDPSDSVVYNTILHEMGHALGLGVLWEISGLTSSFNDGCIYSGSFANSAYFALTGCANVPVIPAGVQCAHFDDNCLGDELMGAVLPPPGVTAPLSTVTVGAINDLGYDVDYSAAQALTVDNSACFCNRRELRSVRSREILSPSPQRHLSVKEHEAARKVGLSLLVGTKSPERALAVLYRGENGKIETVVVSANY